MSLVTGRRTSSSRTRTTDYYSFARRSRACRQRPCEVAGSDFQAGVIRLKQLGSSMLAPAAALGAPRTGTILPSLYSMYAMVVDDAHQHVFVTGSGSNSVVDVLNFDGTLDATIQNEPGAAGMALDTSHGRLYVALQGQGHISVIDTTVDPPVERKSIPVGVASPLMGPIAIAHKRLWFSYGSCAQSGGVASVQRGTGRVRTYGGQGLSGDYCPMLNTSPVDPNLLIEWDAGLTPTTLNRFDLSVNPPKLMQSAWVGGNLHEIAFSPDASVFYTAAGGPEEIDTYLTATLQQIGPTCAGSYPPDAVALSADGRHLVAGFPASEPSISTYHLNATRCAIRQRFDVGSSWVYPTGVATSAGFQHIFVTTGWLDDSVTFTVLT